MVNNLVSSGLAIAVTSGTMYIMEKHLQIDRESTLVAVGSAVDFTTYWSSLFTQFFLRDRKKMKTDGKYDADKVKQTLKGYFGMFGFMAASYTGLRATGQYLLQKSGMDAATATATIQGTLTTIYTGALPMIRYASQKFSGRNFDKKD